MNIKPFILFVLVAAQSVGCDKDNRSQSSPSHAFEMRVEKVEELEGVILKGIAISGTVQNGCIGKADEFSIKRDGKTVLEEIARILNIAGTEPGGEIKKTVKGDYVALYLPDRNKEDVKPGDTVASNTISCK